MRRPRSGHIWLSLFIEIAILSAPSSAFFIGRPIQNNYPFLLYASTGRKPSKQSRKGRAKPKKELYNDDTTISTDEKVTVAASIPSNQIITKTPAEPRKETQQSQLSINSTVPVSSKHAETTSIDKKEEAPSQKKTTKPPITDAPPKVVPTTGFNVVLTHCTADFDSLASAVGLAKLWSAPRESGSEIDAESTGSSFDSASHVPTFVVLPRGAHPGVQKFLALHKHLFPIRSLKSLPSDLSNLNRLALVDAQRRDRLGPAEPLLLHAKRITVVDHHIDQDSDIEATDYVVDNVGSVSTLITEYLMVAQDKMVLTEAEATLLALGIHADTGSLCFDSTTPRDAKALAWCMEQGASQNAISEHAQSSLSNEQQGVLTQALVNANSTRVHGVTLSTVLLSADGFINGLAAVTQDAMELSSSDIFLLALVYESGAGGRAKKKQQQKDGSTRLLTRLLSSTKDQSRTNATDISGIMYTEAWQGGEEGLRRKRLRAAFDRTDTNGSGYLEKKEVVAALASSGVITSEQAVDELMSEVDTNGDGKIDFEEFVVCTGKAEEKRREEERPGRRSLTMIVIGRVKAGVNLRSVKLNKLFEKYGGGGHPKAASATVQLTDESEADGVLQGLVDELITTSLQQQPIVEDFMTSPVLSVQPHMTERQVEDLFVRFDVRALPVCDEDNHVIGLVTYKEVAAAKQRLWNKEQKRLRRDLAVAEKGEALPPSDQKIIDERKQGTNVKAWMLQHVQTVESSKTMAEAESILLETDVGCIPVVDVSNKLVGMVTRTDLLRQHRYYASLHYHNKGFAASIALRSKPMIQLRKYLKRFDKD
jgi:nanoRNase/pAp phosphatase (c-di-AMP/oligoRNAs hydrolase)/predicted transcriptional regulator